MTHPILMEALAAAHRDDLLRAASRQRGAAVAGSRRRRHGRLAAWLDAQLHRPARHTSRPATCAVVTR